MYAIFIKSREFKNLKCDIGCLLVTKTRFYALVELKYFSGMNIFQWLIFSRSEYFSAVNISLGWIFSGWMFFEGVNIFWGLIFFLRGWIFDFQRWIFSENFLRWIILRDETWHFSIWVSHSGTLSSFMYISVSIGRKTNVALANY